MFSKPFKVKSNSQLKGSERKRIRSEILNSFPKLTDDDLTSLISSKEVMSAMKIFTHSGEVVVVYCTHEMPLVFKIEDVMYPSVYLLWKFPNLLHTFTTWPQVLPKLIGGADLMLPGIVLKEELSPTAFGKLDKGDRVAVNLTDNKAPVAVGKAALSSFDMYMAAKRGRGVHILHHMGDNLWFHNTRSKIPTLGPPEGFSNVAEKELEDDTDRTKEDNADRTNLRIENPVSADEGITSCDDSDCKQLASEMEDKCNIVLTDEERSGNDAESADSSVVNSSAVESLSPQEETDKLVQYCFLKAWKTSAKKAELPLLIGNFFKRHMIPACPRGKSIDIKKSSYKKLSKFLNEMQKAGVIVVKELSKGVESIVQVNLNHLMLREFQDTEAGTEEVEEESTEDEVQKYQPPEIVEMYSITAAVVPLFQTFRHKKGEHLSLQDVRKLITTYVKDQNLQDTRSRRHVMLDEVLQKATNTKDTNLSWEELFMKCLGCMGRSCQMTFPGQVPVIIKGKLEPIELTVGTRSGNKKVTLVDNLEVYGINCQEFAHRCQIGVAAGTTINAVPGKKSPQVLVQGNQVFFIGNMLMDEYQINKKYIKGLELAPKRRK